MLQTGNFVFPSRFFLLPFSLPCLIQSPSTLPPLGSETWHFLFIHLKFLATPCGMWDVSSPPRDGACTPCIGKRALTTGPLASFLQVSFQSQIQPILSKKCLPNLKHLLNPPILTAWLCLFFFFSLMQHFPHWAPLSHLSAARTQTGVCHFLPYETSARIKIKTARRIF